MDDTPLLTMTKSRIVDDVPELSEKSSMLYQTLSTLCSFQSCEDLSSFLFTDMFRDLVNSDSPWIIFEIGVYKEHTTVIEAIPIRDGIKFADPSMKGVIPNNIVDIFSEDECCTILHNWIEGNMNA